MSPSSSVPIPNNVKIAVLVAALGYFVDVFDLVLFNVVRVSSLKELGLSPDQILEQGLMLLNMQLIGMLVGGIVWGMLGDIKGRVYVLFGSIMLYSAANIANGFVHDVTSYAILRFIGGFGLAGEVGAGITLVSELMPKDRRGLGTTLVGGVGAAGALIAALAGHWLGWRGAYIAGGLAGILILLLRFGVHESGMFDALKKKEEAMKVDLRLLLTRERFWRYVNCILIGVPIWYFIGMIAPLCPEIGVELGITEALNAGTAITAYTAGLTVGGILCGFISQKMKSRKKVIGLFMFVSFLCAVAVLNLWGQSAFLYYALCLVGGFFLGYWTLFLTVAAEQFGTNIRATVATTVPNFVRGSIVLTNMALTALKGSLGVVWAMQVIGLTVFALGAVALWRLRETFHQDLDFIERHR